MKIQHVGDRPLAMDPSAGVRDCSMLRFSRMQALVLSVFLITFVHICMHIRKVLQALPPCLCI